MVGELVIVGYDVHNTPGYRAGLVAFDAATGGTGLGLRPRPRRRSGRDEPTGCVDVWSSPSVDEARGLVFAATGNCPTSPDGWGDHTEALFAVDLETGNPVWTYQPHEPNNDDLDFAGAPNLFRIGDRDVVGLGNKDGTYYVVDRATGEPVWQAEATEPGLEEEGSNFSTGGFIGGTAVSDGVVAGGTGVGPCPCAHGIDAATGEILWQNEEPAATYASAAVANGVLFLGGNDFTLRALDLATGEILWSEEMEGAVSGGAVVSGDDLFAVAGIREPGLDERSETSGVYRFSLGAGGEPTATTPSTTAAAETAVTALVPDGLPCADDPCPIDFEINEPPPGTRPAAHPAADRGPLGHRGRRRRPRGAGGLGPPGLGRRPGGRHPLRGLPVRARRRPLRGRRAGLQLGRGGGRLHRHGHPPVRAHLQPPERAGDRRRDDRADAVGRGRPARAHAELRPATAGRGTVGSGSRGYG